MRNARPPGWAARPDVGGDALESQACRQACGGFARAVHSSPPGPVCRRMSSSHGVSLVALCQASGFVRCIFLANASLAAELSNLLCDCVRVRNLFGNVHSSYSPDVIFPTQ